MWFGMRLMTEAVGKESQLSRQQLAFYFIYFPPGLEGSREIIGVF